MTDANIKNSSQFVGATYGKYAMLNVEDMVKLSNFSSAM
jgi:hypothetical protein